MLFSVFFLLLFICASSAQNACGSTWWQRHLVVPQYFPDARLSAVLPDFARAVQACTIFGRASLQSGCRNHDECYGTCGSIKSECDSRLVAHWTEVCNDQYENIEWPNPEALTNPARSACRETCKAFVRALYNIMVHAPHFSETAFRNAQETCEPL
jgi:hypothetical protein